MAADCKQLELLTQPYQTRKACERQQLREPSLADSCQEDAVVAMQPWSEEARRNVAAFFRLLDTWDRGRSAKREVA